MATAFTVPGANGTIVSNTFSGSANTALAQSIATTLNGLLTSGLLDVASVAGGSVAPGPPGPRPGAATELEITSGGFVSVPAGYGFVVDGTQNANLSVVGGSNFFGGDGNISYTNAGKSAGDQISAGNGSDTFNLSGIYTVAAGSGFDHYNLSGTGQVSLGGGSNQLSITGGADTVFAGANPGQTGILGGSGSVFFVGGDSPTQVLDFVVGGTGGDTLIGGANNVLVYASPTTGGASNPGALLVAGAGNETLFGALSSTNDTLFANVLNHGNDLLAAGSGNVGLVAGTGQDTLIGAGGNDTFYVTNVNLLSAITKTALTPGVDFLYNSHPGDTLALTGFDTLYGGAAGSGAAAKAIGASLAGGSSAVTLKDGTQITFVGGANGINVISS